MNTEQELQNDIQIIQQDLEQKQESLRENDQGNQFTYYLSSDLESYDEYQEQNKENDQTNVVVQNFLLFFSAFIIQFITYIIYVAFIPIILFKNMFIEKRIDFLKERLWAWVSLWSIIYMRAIDVQSSNSLSEQFEKIINTFNLNRALGNNDLRKKIKQMERFDNFVDYSNINYENYKQKLDVTCPISFQTWDTARKFILSYKKYYLQALELSYLSLIFYYLLVIIICLSAYFELEWLIPKGSKLLKPVVVIISTFNFIFLSVIFLLRFNMGTKYNRSFSKLLSSIQYLQNITSDLSTMYPVFFLQNPDSTNKENRFSAYGMITKRIKLMSNYYIESQILFKDKLFKKEEKQELRRQILHNMQSQLQNIKESILLDEQIHKYKLLNFLEIRSSDFLFTLFLGLAPTLPTIIPVFISYYKS
ncbi:transmembrane protein, putative (macronuclear) [Tetrahymena thermophila SB210]|uniref:Transmembrane protein, putative n=1 Tax=Tetrahymena thermophila (strain SB210) TaxID=312017 RepID=Q246B5_TETTS|nr:transmembrane protein, putative [Tetrahymena thermophila SB210]EAS03468.1 transmembrane protein, putative [Tetrahymena thermophila SB210]|eukprot:XP_001023713.1 transmembrane protein, putative [Tetrahymena thermophila SB210]